MKTEISEMKPGYTVAFKGNGVLFKTMSCILSTVEPGWRKRKWKPWHLATASKKVKAGTKLENGQVAPEDGWMLIEAIAPETGEYYHTVAELEAKTQAYRWLEKPPSAQRIRQFKHIYLGYPYGFFSYIGVVFSYIFRKLFKIKWRVMDTEHMCWEVNSFFVRFMAKQYQPLWEYPMIHQIIAKLEAEQFDDN
ncbi:hypothetical protein ACFLTB_03450 [Chloroflexota bacterium]